MLFHHVLCQVSVIQWCHESKQFSSYIHKHQLIPTFKFYRKCLDEIGTITQVTEGFLHENQRSLFCVVQSTLLFKVTFDPVLIESIQQAAIRPIIPDDDYRTSTIVKVEQLAQNELLVLTLKYVRLLNIQGNASLRGGYRKNEKR